MKKTARCRLAPSVPNSSSTLQTLHARRDVSHPCHLLRSAKPGCALLQRNGDRGVWTCAAKTQRRTPGRKRPACLLPRVGHIFDHGCPSAGSLSRTLSCRSSILCAETARKGASLDTFLTSMFPYATSSAPGVLFRCAALCADLASLPRKPLCRNESGVPSEAPAQLKLQLRRSQS
eukprot:scaffold1638_cov258-Pinguiococcus_pyrenoidosus.AAC.67